MTFSKKPLALASTLALAFLAFHPGAAFAHPLTDAQPADGHHGRLHAREKSR